MRVILLTVVVLFVLGGCKTYIDTEVKISDLLHAKTKTINGNLFIQVSGCGNHKDSRIASESVIEAKNIIPDVFKDAKYVECFRKDFDSYAHFNIPIMLDKKMDGKFASDDYVTISSNEKTLLLLGMPKPLQEKIKNVKNKSININSLNITMSIKLINDTGKPFPFQVFSSYVDGKPFLYGNLTIVKDRTTNIVLSNISTSLIMQDGSVTVLHSPKPVENKDKNQTQK